MDIKELSEGWSFTEIGGGEGTKDGEWLSIEQVPTTVHVELLKAKRIPDPVSRFYLQRLIRVALADITIYQSSSGYMNGTCSVRHCPTKRQLLQVLICDRDFCRGRREGVGIQDHIHCIQRRFTGTQC